MIVSPGARPIRDLHPGRRLPVTDPSIRVEEISGRLAKGLWCIPTY
jgi:hypothetical protein